MDGWMPALIDLQEQVRPAGYDFGGASRLGERLQSIRDGLSEVVLLPVGHGSATGGFRMGWGPPTGSSADWINRWVGGTFRQDRFLAPPQVLLRRPPIQIGLIVAHRKDASLPIFDLNLHRMYHIMGKVDLKSEKGNLLPKKYIIVFTIKNSIRT
jgi:hypothetical protein